MSNTLLVMVEVAKGIAEKELKKSRKKSLKAIVIAAMEAAWNEREMFLISSENDRFKTAVGAAYLLADEAGQERIQTELKLIEKLDAALRGDGPGIHAEKSEGFKPIRLLQLWREVKDAREKGEAAHA